MKQVRKQKEEPSSSPPPWIELPREITANILYRLGVVEILDKAQKVCTTWRSVCNDPCMWRVIDMWSIKDMMSMPCDLEIMCCHAVDRSQGLLADISIGLFVTNTLLLYIAERSSNLKSLRLETFIYDVGSDGLNEAVKSLPLLEELVLNMSFFVTPDFNKSVEIVGRSCPLLKSFGYNNDDPRYSGRYAYVKDNEDAFAIARSMPELRRLQLRRNGLTNEGLEAIINGCPHLESLDLRGCYYVKLKGDLGKRLSAQMKCLTYPTPDYELQEDDYESSDDGYSFWF